MSAIDMADDKPSPGGPPSGVASPGPELPGEIWLLLDSRGIGGIESHVLTLAGALHHRAIPARVVFLTDHGRHPLHAELTAAGLPFSVLAGGWRSLPRTLRTARPGLLHTHGYKAGVLGRLAARLSGIPLVSTFHAGEPGSGRVRLYATIDRATAWLAGGIVAVSAPIAERLPRRTRQIDNFVPLGPGPAGHGSRIAFVGRLSEEKGPDLFCQLAELCPGAELVIYGDGPMRASLQSSWPAVEFAGQQPSMSRLWPGIGLLCMTSRNEGLPMAALEAMAQGIPVAAFAVGGLPGLISPGVNGWLAAPGDMAAMARAVTAWIEAEPAERQRLGEGARATIAARYTPEAVLPRLLAVYRDAGWQEPAVLAGKPDRGPVG